MKRKSYLLPIAAMVLILGLILISTSEAGPPAKDEAARASDTALVPKRVKRSAPSAPLFTRELGSPKREVAVAQGPQLKSAGQPNVLNARSPLSAALLTTLGGRNTQFSEVSLVANFDGREDHVADRAQKVDDFSFSEVEIDAVLTRTAISEHTVANGFAENVYYYGDSLGNLWVGTDTNPGINSTSVGAIDVLRQVNIPALINTGASGGFTLLNPLAGDCTDDQVTVTGIAVNPVADLGDFLSCDVVGEVVYVSVLDNGGCASSAAGQPFRTRVLAFAFVDGVGAGAATPVGAIQILRNSLGNSGIAVDDDGSFYFHLVDNVGLTSAAIFKVTESPRTVAGCATNPRVNRVVASVPSGLTGGIGINTGQGTAAAPILVAGGMRLTNYSGPSPTFGNVVAIAAGPHNVVYAALARSLVGTDDSQTQTTEGLFTNPSALGATPSMIISFADVSGRFDTCTTPDPTTIPGILPVGDGLSDVAQAGLTRVAGVNNFRVFALGNGPDIRPVSPATSAIATSSLLKIDMQIDFTIHSGLAVDEEGTVYVISGGTPAGTGQDPSPALGEILAFPDSSSADRRADFIDLRGNAFPNPPASGGNVGDGDSDRFDHIFLRAPLDPVSNTPTGLAGLARGFLRYTNRLAPSPMGSGVSLGVVSSVLADNATSGQIIFENLDPGHQVAGGDDQNTPFRGDDNDGAGNSPLVGALNGGFEFTFGGPVGTANCVWNGFYLNSNGSISFGAGDTDATPTVSEFYSGVPKIAPAWANLNPSSRTTNPATFPIQALGFTSTNAFKVRWINVPEAGSETCSGTGLAGATNTFAVTLRDDGVSIDENANQALNPANPIGNNSVPFDLQEGRTDSLFVREPNTQLTVGGNPRRDGSGNFVNSYSRMDLLGTAAQPVISGFSIGGLSPLNPPGLCESNLGEAARFADSGHFGALQGQTSVIDAGLLGEGTEPTLFELYDQGSSTVANFDLRFEGNDPALGTPASQQDLNRTDVAYFGVSCTPPANPVVLAVIPEPFVTTPTTTGLVNAIGPVVLNLLGFDFFPNEVTTVCQGFGPAFQRPGKLISTAVTLSYDTNGDAIPDFVIPLGSVTPISENLIRATILPAAGLPGSPFPLNAHGGVGTITLTTLFTPGDNNIFGAFTRTATATINLGTRAPVVTQVSPISGDCSTSQTVAIEGSAFQFTQFVPGGPNINGTATGVFAVEQGNESNVINASSFTVIDNTHINATFNFGAANAGKTFLIFVTGPGGTSRNLTVLPPGAPAVPLGNEAGNLITFGCLANFLQFGAPSVNVQEDCTSVNITVTRQQATPVSVTVDYATTDGTANQKSDYTIALGRLTFAPGELSKNITLLISEDSLVEGNESFTLTLSNATGGSLGSPATTTIQILDDASEPSTNAIDDIPTYVCQLYHDILNRPPDTIGFQNWVNTLTPCPNGGFGEPPTSNCDRLHVASGFFQSDEYLNRGYFAFRFYMVSFNLRPTYLQFIRDMAQVGGTISPAEEEAAKVAYANAFVQRPEFLAAYPGLSGQPLADALLTTAGLPPGSYTAGTQTNGQILRGIAESSAVFNKFLTDGTVSILYFGFQRRDPDTIGYQNNVNTLNANPNNLRHMIFIFIYSTEYRGRFGP